MNKDKAIAIDCDSEVLERIVTALEFYVESQFPPGSADCGQVAREELLNVVASLRASLENHTPARYSRRMRAMVKEGMRVYFEHLATRDGRPHAHECEFLQAASRGGNGSAEALRSAQASDQAGTGTRP